MAPMGGPMVNTVRAIKKGEALMAAFRNSGQHNPEKPPWGFLVKLFRSWDGRQPKMRSISERRARSQQASKIKAQPEGRSFATRFSDLFDGISDIL